MVARSEVKVGGSMSGVKAGSDQGHGEGSMSGGLGSDCRLGRLKKNSLFLSRTYDRIEFHSIPFHSIPFHTIPFHSIPFHSIPFHSIPFHSMFYPMPYAMATGYGAYVCIRAWCDLISCTGFRRRTGAKRSSC